MAGPGKFHIPNVFHIPKFGSRDFDYLLNGFFRKKHYFSREFTSSTIPGDYYFNGRLDVPGQSLGPNFQLQQKNDKTTDGKPGETGFPGFLVVIPGVSPPYSQSHNPEDTGIITHLSTLMKKETRTLKEFKGKT